MPSRKRSARLAARAAPDKIGIVHQFLIVLANTDPLVWRRIQVPEGYSFWDLHVAIQDVMGWSDSHLHDFEVVDPSAGVKVRLGIPHEDALGGKPPAPDWEAFVSDYCLEGSPPALYIYDFGDDWRHAVIYEGMKPPAPAASYPRCIGGANAGPPEDVGGVHGFEAFKTAVSDPSNPNHKQMLEWVGGTYDPTAFDPAAVRFDDPQERWQKAFK